MKQETRCWLCKRTEDEVKAWLEDHDEGIELTKKSRNGWDTDNWEIDEQTKGGLIQRVCSEWINARVPLCVICQGMLIYQGAIAADQMIEEKLAEGELMDYTEYEIVPRDREKA